MRSSIAFITALLMAGLTSGQQPWATTTTLGPGTAGTAGVPRLQLTHPLVIGDPWPALRIVDGLPDAPALLLLGTSSAPIDLPGFGATLWPDTLLQLDLPLGDDGSTPNILPQGAALPAELIGLQLVAQGLVVDAGAVGGAAFTAGLALEAGNGSAAASLFPEPQSLAPGGPRSMAVGDLDGDGRADVVTVDLDNLLTIYLAMPDGGYDLVDRLPTQGYELADVVLADFDEDGALDVVVACGSSPSGNGRLSVRLGDGAGSFGPLQLLGTGNECFGMGVGDVDDDGHLDIVASREGAFVCRLGDGAGGFGAPLVTVAPIGGIGKAEQIQIADITNDGMVDLVTLISSASTLAVIPGFGDGLFGDGQAYASGNINESVVRTIDVNADGAMDVVVGFFTGGFGNPTPPSVSVMFGQPSGVLAEPLLVELPHDPELVQEAISTVLEIACGHWNDDGHIDLAVLLRRGFDSEQYVMLGDGTGDFTATAVAHVDLEGMTFADSDGDGALDLVGIHRYQRLLRVVRGDGQGGLVSLPEIDADVPGEFTLGDLNRDGHADLMQIVDVDGQRTLVVLEGLGEAGFQPAASFPLPGLTSLLPPIDVNGDQRPDLVTAPGTAEAPGSVFLNQGQFQFVAAPDLIMPTPPSPLVGAVIPGHIDGDARLDLLISGSPGWYIVLRGMGDGTFSPGPSGSFAEYPSVAALADLDSDGDLDAVTPGSTLFQFWWHANDGDGNFAPATTIPLPYRTNGAIAVDVDDSGTTDLVFTSTWTPDFLQVVLSDGAGGFSDADVYETPIGFRVTPADMNGDGVVDLFGTAVTGRVLGVLLGLGDGSFAPLQPFGPGHVDTAQLADIDGDGLPDVLASDADGSGRLLLAGNQGG